MAQKPITISGGIQAELVPSTTGPATPGNLIATNGTGVVDATLMPGGSPASTGPATAGTLLKANASGVLDITLIPAGLGASAITLTASGAISAGAAVNIYNNAGTASVRPADSTTPLQAHGYAPSAIASGANGQVDLSPGIISGLSGITVGQSYWLGTSGAFTATAPSTAGNIVQICGVGISTTSIFFSPQSVTTLA
jgi:hypothetical protein